MILQENSQEAWVEVSVLQVVQTKYVLGPSLYAGPYISRFLFANEYLALYADKCCSVVAAVDGVFSYNVGVVTTLRLPVT